MILVVNINIFGQHIESTWHFIWDAQKASRKKCSLNVILKNLTEMLMMSKETILLSISLLNAQKEACIYLEVRH